MNKFVAKVNSSVLEEISDYGFTALPMSPVLKGERLECDGSIETVTAFYGDYIAKVRATGKPAVICFYLERIVKGARFPKDAELNVARYNRFKRFVNEDRLPVEKNSRLREKAAIEAEIMA